MVVRPAEQPSSVSLTGRDLPEQPRALVVRPCREEQRVGGAVIRQRASPEFECPQPVDRQHLVVVRAQLTDEIPAAVELRLIRADLAVAEVADEQVAAEGAETA